MKQYSALDYIKIDIANQFGYDKKTFPQRIAWADSIKDLHQKVDSAEKPAQFLAGVLALEDAQAGVPTGHMVGLDACSSGIAILGILMGCHVTSQNTGIIGQKRMDMYSVCTDEVNSRLKTAVQIPRADVKDAQMTHFYGSKAEPRRVFGKDTEELQAFYDAQYTVAPGACVLMQEFLGSWQPFALEHSHTLPDGHHSIVPVLHKMKAKIEIDELAHTTLSYIFEDNIGSEKGLAVAANMTHAVDGFLVRETVRRCNYDPAQLRKARDIILDHAGVIEPNNPIHEHELNSRRHQFLSLRGVEFVIAQPLMFTDDYRAELLQLIEETLARPTFEMITIHDEFKCHPNYVNHMREVYRDILAELADSNVGQQIIREVRGDDTYVLQKMSTTLGNDIMNAEYFLS